MFCDYIWPLLPKMYVDYKTPSEVETITHFSYKLGNPKDLNVNDNNEDETDIDFDQILKSVNKLITFSLSKAGKTIIATKDDNEMLYTSIITLSNSLKLHPKNSFRIFSAMNEVASHYPIQHINNVIIEYFAQPERFCPQVLIALLLFLEQLFNVPLNDDESQPIFKNINEFITDNSIYNILKLAIDDPTNMGFFTDQDNTDKNSFTNADISLCRSQASTLLIEMVELYCSQFPDLPPAQQESVITKLTELPSILIWALESKCGTHSNQAIRKIFELINFLFFQLYITELPIELDDQSAYNIFMVLMEYALTLDFADIALETLYLILRNKNFHFIEYFRREEFDQLFNKVIQSSQYRDLCGYQLMGLIHHIFFSRNEVILGRLILALTSTNVSIFVELAKYSNIAKHRNQGLQFCHLCADLLSHFFQFEPSENINQPIPPFLTPVYVVHHENELFQYESIELNSVPNQFTNLPPQHNPETAKANTIDENQQPTEFHQTETNEVTEQTTNESSCQHILPKNHPLAFFFPDMADTNADDNQEPMIPLDSDLNQSEEINEEPIVNEPANLDITHFTKHDYMIMFLNLGIIDILAIMTRSSEYSLRLESLIAIAFGFVYFDVDMIKHLIVGYNFIETYTPMISASFESFSASVYITYHILQLIGRPNFPEDDGVAVLLRFVNSDTYLEIENMLNFFVSEAKLTQDDDEKDIDFEKKIALAQLTLAEFNKFKKPDL